MGNVFNLDSIRIIKQKIGTLINDGKLDEAIYNGIKVVNSSDYNLIKTEDKGVLCFKIAYAYKKSNRCEEAILFLNDALKYSNKAGDKDHYNRSLWLKNNCEIELGIDDRETIINNFVEIRDYYYGINKKITSSIIGFTMAYYDKSIVDMMMYFRKIVEVRKIDITVEPNYDISSTVIDMIKEMKEVDESICEEAETYLKNLNLKCACI